MDVGECIKTRRSVHKFLRAEIEQEKLGDILIAGKSAPSAGNLQSWRFVVVRGKSGRKVVAEACLHQMWMAEAPVQIVICAEVPRVKLYYGNRGERLYSIQNCAAAAQNMLLMAHSLGLGSCWVGAFEEDMLKRAIGLGDQARPQAVIVLGYSNEEVPEPMSLTLETITFFESYGNRIERFNLWLGQFGAINKKRVNNAKELIKDKIEDAKHSSFWKKLQFWNSEK